MTSANPISFRVSPTSLLVIVPRERRIPPSLPRHSPVALGVQVCTGHGQLLQADAIVQFLASVARTSPNCRSPQIELSGMEIHRRDGRSDR